MPRYVRSVLLAIGIVFSCWVVVLCAKVILGFFLTPAGPWPHSTLFSSFDSGVTTGLLARQESLAMKQAIIAGPYDTFGSDSGRGKTSRYGPQKSYKEIVIELNTKPKGIEDFIRVAKNEIRKLVLASRAEILNVSDDSDGDGFNLDYTEGPCKGTIRVRLDKIADNKYRLGIRIDETQGD